MDTSVWYASIRQDLPGIGIDRYKPDSVSVLRRYKRAWSRPGTADRRKQ